VKKNLHVLLTIAFLVAACSSATPTPETKVVPTLEATMLKRGIVLVGPKNDHGWSQAQLFYY